MVFELYVLLFHNLSDLLTYKTSASFRSINFIHFASYPKYTSNATIRFFVVEY